MNRNSLTTLLFVAVAAILIAGESAFCRSPVEFQQGWHRKGRRSECPQNSFFSCGLIEAMIKKTDFDSGAPIIGGHVEVPAGFTVPGFGLSAGDPTGKGKYEDEKLQSIEVDPAWVNRSGILRDYSLLMMSQQLLLMRWSKFRHELKGPFFSDYINTATHLKRGFWDGDHWFWDGVMHPIQGGITYHIAHSRGASDFESFAWGLGYSLTYELSPVGQAGLGNIRVSPIDLLVTPVAGMGWAKLEYWLDGKIAKMNDPTDRKLLRSLLPAHVITNLLRFRAPWDRRALE